tara:strand:- start:4796 stop:5572 length:777 start_codon:yes stop_codon:yes gene_type:complete
MKLGLTGQRVLITGGSRGIGLAAALEFAAEGCILDLVSRNPDHLAAASEAIGERWDVPVTTHSLDLSTQKNIARLFETCRDTDILVNNAGAIPAGDLQQVGDQRWRDAWDLKVFGYVGLSRLFYPEMKDRGHGVIVNVIGLAGERPDTNYIAGSVGNSALIAFTRALGSHSLDDGVRVVGINPGPVQTDRIVALLQARAQREKGDSSRWADYLEALPLGRAAKPEEVADLVVFLASERASYLCGSVVTLDGGLGARSH